ncbi:MAG TPA: Gfo/Idh/MocA family oxidoreductase [Verrucomicrobiae bacterium]|nr:Gfo/Idh/MocA family oxidoreductase [Verrucomicrobiae bacterium]
MTTPATSSADGRRVGFAIAGLGSLSANQIAPALAKTRHCRLAGIVTNSAEKARAWQQHYELPDRAVYRYDNMEAMADNPDIDAVFIVTPNALHAEHTAKAARAGKHVLCEKPMEVSVERCQRMIDACRKAGRQLAIAYRCQFEPHNLEAIRLAREEVFGKTRIIEATFGFPLSNEEQWRLRHDLAGGGALMDVGVYALQATRYLTGEEPVMVSALETKTNPARFKEVDETVTWQMTFPSGVIAHCATSYNVDETDRFTVIAERGRFGLAPAFSYNGMSGWRSDGQPFYFPQTDHFAVQMDDFAECILTGRPTRVPGEEGLRDMRVIEAIYESIRTGKTVRLG